MQLARDLGVLDTLDVAPVPPADEALLRLVHGDAYIEAVRGAGALGSGYDLGHGLGTPDVPVFPDMHEVSARVAAATVGRRGRRVVRRGGARVQPGGRAAPRDAATRAAGFCVYNDVAVAIAGLLEPGAERVAYVDIDVHHGDGVEAAFWDDPRVLTISLHEDSARRCIPGTGLPVRDSADRAAQGYAVNLALPRRGPRTTAGCARFTRWSRTCCGRSTRRSWSRSTAATATTSTRSPTSH